MSYSISLLNLNETPLKQHSHDVYEVLFYIEGNGELCYGNKSFSVSKNSIVILKNDNVKIWKSVGELLIYRKTIR